MNMKAALTVLVSLVACISLASVGRAGDWSPFALILAGWVIGLVTMIALGAISLLEEENR